VLAATLHLVKRSYLLGLGAVVLLASCMAPPTSTGPLPSAPGASGEPALDALAHLQVKGRAPRTGYSRAEFGEAWTDDNGSPMGHDGCSTRENILARDLSQVTFRKGHCKVASGTLLDPYSGVEVHFVRGPETSPLVQIDHVVPMSNAWQTGAQTWSAQQRQDFANDPLELIATRGTVNDAKGDGDAATWLPSDRTFRCAYAARMVAIKLKWRLWATRPEHDALQRLLGPCPNQMLPIEPGAVR
jgi:hypothetical protein